MIEPSVELISRSRTQLEIPLPAQVDIIFHSLNTKMQEMHANLPTGKKRIITPVTIGDIAKLGAHSGRRDNFESSEGTKPTRLLKSNPTRMWASRLIFPVGRTGSMSNCNFSPKWHTWKLKILFNFSWFRLADGTRDILRKKFYTTSWSNICFRIWIQTEWK